MSETLVLSLPDFTQNFVVETDACKNGVGAVLMQNGRPLAYYSKAISSKDTGLLTYEKELLAVVQEVQKWRGYLLGKKFNIKTDQQALKHLLNQKITTLVQQMWLTKLLGLDYVIEYKKGKDNLVIDPLSRLYDDYKEEEGELQAISIIVPMWKADLKQSWEEDDEVLPVIAQLAIDPTGVPGYSLLNGELKHHDQLYVGTFGNLRQ